MNGIGSLNETARNMSRGPRGLAGYQQFAGGGEGVRPRSRPPEMQEMAEIRAYLGSLSDDRPRSRPEKYFEINSYDINGETQDAIDFKDGMRMFMPDVENMIRGNRTASEPLVGRETGQEVLEFLQENNPTSEEFIDYFSSARLASGGEALGPPPLRGPDPQGIGAYQQFADGGPVYMAEGGAQMNPLPSDYGRVMNFGFLENMQKPQGPMIPMDPTTKKLYDDMIGTGGFLPGNPKPSDYDRPPMVPAPDVPQPVIERPQETMLPTIQQPQGPFPQPTIAPPAVMNPEPDVMYRGVGAPLVMDREPLVMDRDVMNPQPSLPAPDQPVVMEPQPLVSPVPSALNIGAGMSANDLQRMLARRSVGPTNLNEVNSSILSLQQADVANRARRANVPPQRPLEPPPPSLGIATAVPSPFGPGSPYGGTFKEQADIANRERYFQQPPQMGGFGFGNYQSPPSLYGNEMQPRPESYGIGSFGQPMQQQGFGSNKPTANVLF